jgi:hypothetical protein
VAKLFTNSWRYPNFPISNQFCVLARTYGLDFHRINDAVTRDLSTHEELCKPGFAAGPCLLKDTPASRYTRGGSQIGGPVFKRMLSRWGRTLRLFRRLPTCDVTNAFKLYDAAMLNSLNLQSRSGFEITFEITVKALLAGYRIAELPATCRDRIHGRSHFWLWRWLPLSLRWYIWAFRPRASRAPNSRCINVPSGLISRALRKET